MHSVQKVFSRLHCQERVACQPQWEFHVEYVPSNILVAVPSIGSILAHVYFSDYAYQNPLTIQINITPPASSSQYPLPKQFANQFQCQKRIHKSPYLKIATSKVQQSSIVSEAFLQFPSTHRVYLLCLEPTFHEGFSYTH